MMDAEEPIGYIISHNQSKTARDTLEIPIYKTIQGEIIGHCKIAPYSAEKGSSITISDLNGNKFPVYRYPLNPLKNKQFYAIKYLKSNSIDSCEYYSHGNSFCCNSLVFYGRYGNYLKILANTIDGGGWIQISNDICGTTTWRDEILSSFHGSSVWGFDNYGLKLFPSSKSESLVSLEPNIHSIIAYTRILDNWIEIKVCQLKPEVEITGSEVKEYRDCEKTYIGWIRIVDEKGMPTNIWFSNSL